MDPYTQQNNPEATELPEQAQPQPEPVTTPPLSAPSPQPPRKSSVLKIILIITASIVGGLVLLGIVFAMVIGSLLGGSADTHNDKTAVAPSVIDTTKEMTVSGSVLNAQCFRLTLPSGYEIKPGSAGCSTNLNISKGDSLTAILVTTQTGDEGTIEQLSDKLLAMAQDADLKDPVAQVMTLNNSNRIAHLTFKDSNNLEKSLYLIPDPEHHFKGKDGSVVTSFIIGSYSYNDALRANLNTVVQSFAIKK